jgi:hypothetical protein
LPPANHNLTASAAKAGVTGKRARFGWVMLQGWAGTNVIAKGYLDDKVVTYVPFL